MRRRHRSSFEAELAAVPLFAALAPEEISVIAAAATRAREPAGMLFSKEGERGDELVIVLEGEVEVRHDGGVLATLGPGEFVGEIALLDDGARRTAPVVARTPVVVAYLGRYEFDRLTATNPSLLEAIEETRRRRTEGA